MVLQQDLDYIEMTLFTGHQQRRRTVLYAHTYTISVISHNNEFAVRVCYE